ncbi:MAG TPA: tripartite tricarboxylate transporter substrate binding protein [Burkholderiales bacterium]|nr:tripartite tricarboxylate transporter substrate binding protein [Burkholderiales bacterium]
MIRLWLAILLAAFAPLAGAQGWPTKPVRIVLQFPPGGSTDVVARILAQAMTQSLGQPVIVENKPGADGAIAADQVMRAEPDGHTFFLASNTPMMQVPLLRKNPPYDPVKNFTAVSLVGRYVYLLVVTPSLPVKNVTELIAYARDNPGRLNYGSYSGVTQLMYANIRSASKIDMTAVPYKGEGPTVADIIGGHVQLTFATPTSTLAHIKDGKLRALATLLPARFALLPEVPAAAEAGLPPFTAGTWAALFGPAKLPLEITARMNKELNAAMRRPDVREKIDRQGFELAGSTPEEMAAFLQEQLVAWSRAFREAGMNPE